LLPWSSTTTRPAGFTPFPYTTLSDLTDPSRLGLLERVHRDSRDLRDPPPFVPGSPKDGPQQGKMPVDSRLGGLRALLLAEVVDEDRKSTRLNSSHGKTSYAVFCLNKK